MSHEQLIAQAPAVDFDPLRRGYRAARWGLSVIVFAVIGGGVWAAIAPISGAVIAVGAVKVDTNRKTIQHQEGGIVKAILVRDGDRVAAGQPLIVLDDVKVDSSYMSLRMQLDAELARSGRLTAERDLSTQVIF